MFNKRSGMGLVFSIVFLVFFTTVLAETETLTKPPSETAASAAANPIKVIEKKVDDVLIASVRYQGKYEDMGAYIGTLMKAAGRFAAGPVFGLYHDDGTTEIHDVEVCVPVSDTVKTKDVATRLLPGGPMLSYTHSGDYSRLAESWGKLFRYIEAEKLQTGMPVREIYLVWDEKDPSKNQTELLVPLIVKKED